MKHSTLPVVLSAAAVGICFALGASSSAPEGTALADLPGSARLYTAEQVAALFSSLDATNAIEAMQAILSTNAVLRAELMEMHGRDCLRATNSAVADGALVIDPYGEQEAFVWSADSLDNMLVRMGLLENAAQGDCGYGDQYVWPSALWFARSMYDAVDTDFESPSEMVRNVKESARRNAIIPDDVYDDLAAASQNLVSLAGESATLLSLAQNPPQGCTCDPASVNSRLAALEARPTCGCNLSDISAVVSDLENALSALQAVAADLSSVSSSAADLESRLSAIESALQSLSPQEVAERTGSPVEVVEETIDRAQQDAAAAADDVTAIADAASEIESFGDAVDDVAEEVDAIVDILGEV